MERQRSREKATDVRTSKKNGPAKRLKIFDDSDAHRGSRSRGAWDQFERSGWNRCLCQFGRTAASFLGAQKPATDRRSEWVSDDGRFGVAANGSEPRVPRGSWNNNANNCRLGAAQEQPHGQPDQRYRFPSGPDPAFRKNQGPKMRLRWLAHWVNSVIAFVLFPGMVILNNQLSIGPARAFGRGARGEMTNDYALQKSVSMDPRPGHGRNPHPDLFPNERADLWGLPATMDRIEHQRRQRECADERFVEPKLAQLAQPVLHPGLHQFRDRDQPPGRLWATGAGLRRDRKSVV